MELPISTKFIFAAEDRVAIEPSLPGTLILTDAGRLFLDRPDNGERLEITDVRVCQLETDRLAIKEPTPGFYYVVSDNKLYRYLGDHAWQCLNPDPAFIGGDGRIRREYLPPETIFLGPGETVPEGYLALATSTSAGIVRLGSTGGAARFGHPEDLGLGNLTDLTTEAKTLVGAINELKARLDEK